MAKDYDCPHCGRTFKRAFHLKRHLRTQHGDVKAAFVCDICTKAFSRTDNLKAHRKSRFVGDQLINVKQKELLQCYVCDKTFDRIFNLKRHQRTVHRKGCDKSCQQEGKDTENRKDIEGKFKSLIFTILELSNSAKY